MVKLHGSRLTEAGLAGAFYLGYLDQNRSYIRGLATTRNSNQKKETWAGAGTGPRFQRFDGEMPYSKLTDNEVEVVNEKFATGVEVERDDWNDDKTGTIMESVSELGSELVDFQDQMILETATRNIAGKNCYDGQPLYSANHQATTDGGGTNQTNIADISGGTVDSDLYKQVLYRALQVFGGMQDDRGRYVHHNRLGDLMIVYPTMDIRIVQEAYGNPLDNGGGTNVVVNQGRYRVRTYDEMLLEDDKHVFVFATSGISRKPVLFQQKRGPERTYHGPGSVAWMDQDLVKFGIKWDGSAHPWWWHTAVRIQIRA
ncbi:MAG: Mu-like prophage major head subunit gpT family protein [Planctomycetes bacterium]|nr:Mu-like prophage major head subunit gpT family protein [Planctomycetota bacterium]